MASRLFKKTRYITVSTTSLNRNGSDDGSGNNGDNDNMEGNKPYIPDGLCVKCKSCGKILYKKDLEENNMVCSFCNFHFRMNARERIALIADEGTFIEYDKNMRSVNPLNFPGYTEKVEGMRKKTGMNEAVITGQCKINGMDSVIAVMDSNFMMGSMGSVVGEKITRAVEKATALKFPLIIFTTSGGARMQEGMLSLMQMAKVSEALARHSSAGLLYVTVLTDPTTGGVTASFAMLGDIILSEPHALVGFAGRRVIENTINEELPQEFQKAEFLLKHGFIDKIVERKDLKKILGDILELHEGAE